MAVMVIDQNGAPPEVGDTNTDNTSDIIEDEAVGADDENTTPNDTKSDVISVNKSQRDELDSDEEDVDLKELTKRVRNSHNFTELRFCSLTIVSYSYIINF